MCALDITYDQAHAYIKKEMKRVDRKGTYTSAYAKNVVNTVKNNKRIHFIGTHPSKAYINNMVCGNAKKKILAIDIGGTLAKTAFYIPKDEFEEKPGEL